jgi:hypothetical protein
MNSTQLQLVTYEQAKKLDAAGFNRETRIRYDHDCKQITETSTDRDHNDPNKWTNKDKQGCSAPTVALALKWMRDNKPYNCSVERSLGDRGYWGRYRRKNEYGGRRELTKAFTTNVFNTHEDAESALLDELLNLIENKS